MCSAYSVCSCLATTPISAVLWLAPIPNAFVLETFFSSATRVRRSFPFSAKPGMNCSSKANFFYFAAKAFRFSFIALTFVWSCSADDIASRVFHFISFILLNSAPFSSITPRQFHISSFTNFVHSFDIRKHLRLEPVYLLCTGYKRITHSCQCFLEFVNLRTERVTLSYLLLQVLTRVLISLARLELVLSCILDDVSNSFRLRL